MIIASSEVLFPVFQWTLAFQLLSIFSALLFGQSIYFCTLLYIVQKLCQLSRFWIFSYENNFCHLSDKENVIKLLTKPDKSLTNVMSLSCQFWQIVTEKLHYLTFSYEISDTIFWHKIQKRLHCHRCDFTVTFF